MGAPLKLVGLQTLLQFTFSKFSSDFSDFRSWCSATDSSPTVHRATTFLYCSSVRSWLVAFAFRPDRFGAESALAGSVTGSFSAGVAAEVAAGNNSSCPYQSDRPYSGTSTRPWYGCQLTGQKWSPSLHSANLKGLQYSDCSSFQGSAAALVPSGAESPQMLPALPSTKPLPAVFVQSIVLAPADLVSFFRQEGPVFFWVRE